MVEWSVTVSWVCKVVRNVSGLLYIYIYIYCNRGVSYMKTGPSRRIADIPGFHRDIPSNLRHKRIPNKG